MRNNRTNIDQKQPLEGYFPLFCFRGKLSKKNGGKKLKFKLKKGKGSVDGFTAAERQKIPRAIIITRTIAEKVNKKY
jgi:hypothetical protein